MFKRAPLPHTQSSILFLSSALLLTVGCAEFLDEDVSVDESVDAVVNGTPVVGYPSAGGLLRGDSPENAFMQCSGTLVGCDTYVTAAHCVCEDPTVCNQPIPASQLFVYFQNGGIYPASDVIIEPNYSFPGFGDVAVIRLAVPVIGIKPTPIIRTNPAINAQMTIVGYGLTFNGENDSGIKREGVLQRAGCNGFSNDTHMCFNPNASPSVSCSGDSGGPNYIDIGGELHLGAVVSGGGTQNSCTGGQKFATNVAEFASFIEASGGTLGGEQCGTLPNASDASTAMGTVEGNAPGGETTIEVPSGTTELRVGVNAIFGELDIFVKLGEPARQENADCFESGRQTAYCVIKNPEAGTWHVNVLSETPYQMAMTALSGGPLATADVYDATAGELLTINAEEGVLVNDTAGRGLPLVPELLSQPANGTALVGPAGELEYQSNGDFIGTDSFTYRLQEEGYVSPPVTVTIEVVEGGCGCTSSGSSGAGTGLLFALALLLGFGRRRRGYPLSSTR